MSGLKEKAEIGLGIAKEAAKDGLENAVDATAKGFEDCKGSCCEWS